MSSTPGTGPELTPQQVEIRRRGFRDLNASGSVLPGELVADAVASVAQRWFVVFGECRGVRSDTTWIRFSVSSPGGAQVSVHLFGQRLAKVRGYHGSHALDEVLSDGNMVTVAGILAIDSWTNELVLHAHLISPTSAPLGWQRAARAVSLELLRVQFGGQPDRLRRLSVKRIHVRKEQLHMVLPAPFTRVVAVTPRVSETKDDLYEGLRASVERRGLRFELKTVSFSGPHAAAGVASAITEVDKASTPGTIIAIHRGGGNWQQLDVFDDAAVVMAIASCAHPVVTAIGHHNNETLSDRAAIASLDTPTRLGEALGRLFWQRSGHTKAPAVRPVSATPVDLAKSAEVMALTAQFREAQRSAQFQFERRIAESAARALRRVSVRARWGAWLCGSASVTCGVIAAVQTVATAATETAGVLAAVCVLALVLAIGFGTGRKRAARPVSARLASKLGPRYSEEWFHQAQRVRTPRAYRRTFGAIPAG